MDRLTPSSENRRFPRANHRLPFEMSVDGRMVAAETINLSGNGAFCRVNRPIPEMTELDVVLALPSPKAAIDYVNCGGVVVRADDGNRIAVFFHRMEPDQRRKLVDYLTRQEAEPRGPITA
jgi:hypothetical protein